MPKKKFYPPNDTGTKNADFVACCSSGLKHIRTGPVPTKQSDQAYPPRLTDGGLDIPTQPQIKHITGG